MVGFQSRVAKKRYLNSKRIYEYRRISLQIPRRFHGLIESFLKRELEMKIATQNGSLIITLNSRGKSAQF